MHAENRQRIARAYRLIPAEAVHLKSMARCHIRCFPDEFTSRMGERFSAAFYNSYIADPGGIAFVAVEEQTQAVLGQVAGGRPEIRREFLRGARRRFFWRLLGKFFADRKVCLVLLKEVGRRLGLRRGESEPGTDFSNWGTEARWALLQVICVRPEARGTGVASELMKAFRGACRRAGYPVMYLPVFSDNARAISFYRKDGWQIVKEIGRTVVMRCYNQD